jgi:hypothetical protein
VILANAASLAFTVRLGAAFVFFEYFWNIERAQRASW